MKPVIVCCFMIIGYILLLIPSSSPIPSITTKCIIKFDCIPVREITVLCANLNLTTTPKCLENVENLDLSGNFLLYLDKEDFPNNFNPLSTLTLHNSNVKFLASDTFDNLPNLQKLDLSLNFLKFFYTQMLENHTQLEHLNFSSNLMKKLGPNQFISCKLRILDLSNNFLEFIDETAFEKLPVLEWLSLRDNKLRILPVVAVYILLLGGSNLWNCDCIFYTRSKNRTSNQEHNDKNFTCVDSDQNHITWQELEFSEDQCNQDQIPNIIKKTEKPTKAENSPDVILDVYGYVLIALTILIFLCCCCDGRQRRFRGKHDGEILHFSPNSPFLSKSNEMEVKIEKSDAKNDINLVAYSITVHNNVNNN